mmetsp:Transcript_28763/g.92869  ORF Transcript_28763/g.92869 Transcript_28763/m.92869 type:complete len:242 (-) Transcript_28763:66-791(-)
MAIHSASPHCLLRLCTIHLSPECLSRSLFAGQPAGFLRLKCILPLLNLTLGQLRHLFFPSQPPFSLLHSSPLLRSRPPCFRLLLELLIVIMGPHALAALSEQLLELTTLQELHESRMCVKGHLRQELRLVDGAAARRLAFLHKVLCLPAFGTGSLLGFRRFFLIRRQSIIYARLAFLGFAGMTVLLSLAAIIHFTVVAPPPPFLLLLTIVIRAVALAVACSSGAATNRHHSPTSVGLVGFG